MAHDLRGPGAAADGRHAAVGPLTGLVGDSAPMVALRALVRRVAPLSAPVLIQGETGTGKELVARALAEIGRGPAAPFVALNCGGLRGTLAQAELFGHEAGAFTGAIGARAGAFEQAHGGTLFLDELGELPLAGQALLLRALDGGEVRRLGAIRPRCAQPRVVAATHRPLAARVGRGRFRADLFFRLHVLVVRVPPLRERLEDLPALAAHLLALERLPGGTAPPPPTLTAAALVALRRHAWPGNVRELRLVLQRALVTAPTGPLDADAIDLRGLLPVGDRRPRGADMEAIKGAALAAALRQHSGNRSAAAAALGISRATVHRRLAAAAGRPAAGAEGAPDPQRTRGWCRP